MQKKVIKVVGGKTFAEQIAENMKIEREKREFDKRLNSEDSNIRMKKVSIGRGL